MAPVRGRFAPTPSGELHLGNARTALLAWLQVRSLNGQLVMRVEDLDRARTVAGAEARQLQALRTLGLDWDEGPDIGGPHDPYRQSERAWRYAEAVAALGAQGRIYPCYCSRAEVAALAPQGPEGPRYPGSCRQLTAAQRAALEAQGRRPALRFRVRPGLVAFDDEVAGRFAQDVEAEVGDFVVRRADGVYAYQLAVAVDDIAMGITHVLRGGDLLGSTPRQLQLYQALGAVPPRFAHVGLVVGPDGERLAKRGGLAGISTLLERGLPAQAIRAWLEWSCGGLAEPARFRLDHVPKGPVRCPPEL